MVISPYNQKGGGLSGCFRRMNRSPPQGFGYNAKHSTAIDFKIGNIEKMKFTSSFDVIWNMISQPYHLVRNQSASLLNHLLRLDIPRK
jgi:hypothetical protein